MNMAIGQNIPNLPNMTFEDSRSDATPDYTLRGIECMKDINLHLNTIVDGCAKLERRMDAFAESAKPLYARVE
jgi:hypothetical protein